MSIILISELMTKLNSNSFNREQLNIIEKYNNKDKKLFLTTICIVFASSIFDSIFRINLIFDIIDIVIIILSMLILIRYLYFKITMKKSLLIELQEIENKKMKIV
ncbi:hypothetical protein FDE76_15155 [Clostridium botulinum]|uniref:Uncharacterized protein n=2 Tax=Clostridium botulinum TaxID=1491 RepID=A0A0A0UTH1_CLOBO|nr:hypothetical protein [Clostridium botulinum]ACD14200.1 hypothetical protein CLL_0024 [Clostridium botulinum B str. Eklund 17B (NRP)]AIW54509.1 hypothetical protein [Clostridium botulinum]AIW54563.1 hypothetical protein [Clostridium botulinum]ALP69009.1 hypothetical protein [Clostridium botulinum]MBY6977859.1 hypothetical protein [Clostridium botulinum]